MNLNAPDYQLRPSAEADYDAIAEVWRDSASLPNVGPPVMPTLDELRQRLAVESDSGWQVTVADRGGIIIGFVAIRPDKATLNELFVRPGSIGGGVGRALLAHAMAAMPGGFTLLTRASNLRARRFYEKAGLALLRKGTHPRTCDPIIYYGWGG